MKIPQRGHICSKGQKPSYEAARDSNLTIVNFRQLCLLDDSGNGQTRLGDVSLGHQPVLGGGGARCWVRPAHHSLCSLHPLRLVSLSIRAQWYMEARGS